ncbi:MAG: YihA family ribosome biogenesis GTP-binding protein [Candidatus Coatesbacteria bacterium]|nr:YihA family ribosome biogenesis GTP-binding protein [Candidatus Coatesbacteria bacterium]
MNYHPEIKFYKCLNDYPSRFPLEARKGYALIGRSNVGKSSLINSLANSTIARVSNTPGKTITINYYIVDGNWYIIDLPGYGYAKRSHEIRTRWDEIMSRFWKNNKTDIKGLILIDARHIPNKLDLDTLMWLNDNQISYIVVANKTDKLNSSENQRLNARIRDSYGIEENLLFKTSMLKKTGINELLDYMMKSIAKTEV